MAQPVPGFSLALAAQVPGFSLAPSQCSPDGLSVCSARLKSGTAGALQGRNR